MPLTLLVLLAALLSVVPACLCQDGASPTAFALSTSNPGFPAGGQYFSVAALQSNSAGLTGATIPVIIGGVTAGGVYSNSVYVANDYLGTSWTSVSGPFPFGARAGGGLIAVPVSAPGVVQILVLIGGVSSISVYQNDVYSSVDSGFVGGRSTLAVTWVRNTGSVAFSKRAYFGLQIAAGFNNTSTSYAYLIGGATPNVDLVTGNNDVYYTVGMTTSAAWRSLSSAPWPGRWAFGISNFTFSSGVNGIIIAGGTSFNQGFINFNDVWTWDVSQPGASGWSQRTSLNTVFPATGWLSIIYNTTNLFIVAGNTALNIYDGQLWTAAISAPGNWFATTALPPNPRGNVSVIQTTNDGAGNASICLYIGGNIIPSTNYNDVWSSVIGSSTASQQSLLATLANWVRSL